MMALVLGGFESIAGIGAAAGAVVLLLALVALGGTAYKHFTGGIEWPDEEEGDGVVRNNDDDEWKYG